MIKKLSSKEVYKNKWMKVREDAVEFSGGNKGIYGVVEKPDFALIVPFSQSKLYLVRQYRYPVEASFWEFPQGSYEQQPDIDPSKLAQQELEEEAGLKAKNIKAIGYLYEAYGFSNQGFTVFLAKDLQQGAQQLEASEGDMEVSSFSIEQFEQMVTKGEIKDAPTVSAYGLLKMQRII